MKKLTKLLALALVLVLGLSLLTGCESEEDKIAKIEGQWYCHCPESEQVAENLLYNLDFYEEEVALVDLSTLMQVRKITFTQEKDYRIGYDVEGLKAYVREFLDGAYDALYNNRQSLGSLYGVSFDDMTREEFKQFYAELYTQPNYEALLTYFAGNAYNYNDLVSTETGTFTISGNKILCKPLFETEAEAIYYELLEDGSLELEFANVTEIYTRK